MDFNLANQYAKQILEGRDDLHKKLVKLCIPYLYKLRKELGFCRVTLKEIRDELASDAVSDAIMAQQIRELPFSICVRNTFRDLCRKKEMIIREHDTKNIASQCDIEESPRVMGFGTTIPSPLVKAHEKDVIELAENILKNHDRFSKQVVYQKTRGSTYPDMADIFSTTLNECKRVYWHDINHIRKQFKRAQDELSR